jgi:Flp pilus assembly protein TadG
MAVVSPFLVLMLFGIVEFGSLLFVRQSMVLAARSGARQLAIQGATESGAITIAGNYLSASGIRGGVVTAQNAYAGAGDDAAAREVWVQVDLPAANAFLLGDALNLFADGANLTVRATMRKEGELLVAPAP